MANINYIVITVRHTDVATLVRPMASNPAVCEGNQIINGCLNAINQYLSLGKPPSDKPLLPKKEVDSFTSMHLNSFTAFSHDESIQNLMLAVRVVDINNISHVMNLVLQKVEAVNPYKG